LVPEYPIVTSRLKLRPLGTGDVDALLAYRSDPEVCRYLPFDPMTRSDIVERIGGQWTRTTLEQEGEWVALGVERRDSGELVGDVILIWHSRRHGHGEVGWVFHPDHSGQGFATEAARACLDLLFHGLKLHRVSARLDSRNHASARLTERLGMRREAHLVENEWFKGEWTDELTYALLESEWRSQAAAAAAASSDSGG
jgi:RimJ/RimL family protein N-acetyltransferase